MWNLIFKTLRMNIWVIGMTVVFMGIEIGRRDVVLWALTIVIVMLRRAVILNSVLLGRAAMVGRANVLLGVVMVGRAIVLWRWTAVLLGMTVITVV